ncbi:MAG: GNAT family N-acetyltransferase [Casimicrobiaceae bacterium]|nr:GNAT family N-acetyltransferase [Casimicrobiaceae bacterium]MDW8312497.1 GNAT family N-acetyltransferase [Burkholderiales bacterium]
MSAAVTLSVLSSLAGIDPAAWDRLLAETPGPADGGGRVFLRHAYLYALETSGCVGGRTGWQPCYLIAQDGGRLVGAVPLYLKAHSYGEFVFDWAWADAHRRAGLAYYPKLVAAVPFTPCPGPRVLAACETVAEALIAEALALVQRNRLSSLHVLFPDAPEAERWARQGLLLRRGVQFHWHNRREPAPWRDFEEMLAAMSHDKRKKIRQDRRYVIEAGVSAWRMLDGATASHADWAFFTRCYERTYATHFSTPYLNLDFFLALARAMPEALRLWIGERAGEPVCASLCVQSGRVLHGRYWGTLEAVRSLHFEACYYRPIEWAIAEGLTRFEGGAQGVHKLARGLLPVATHSAHWIAEPRFRDAIEEFCARERIGVAHTLDELAESAPFKTAPTVA